ncbi:MAG: tetratricopeptide repeat protein, partial [Acidobacteriota bacterium]
LDIARRLANDAPTPEALRDLSISLERVGDVRRARGLLEDAANAHDASHHIRRRLANDYGPTPEALRDLSVGLERVGDVRRTRGRLEDAGNAHDESLDIRRRLAKDAPTPEALRDLSLSLWRVGDLAREAGEADRARALLEESRDLQRQLLKILDPLPQVLGDSKLILGTLRDLYEELSDTEALEGASDELTALSGTGEPPTEPSPG